MAVIPRTIDLLEQGRAENLHVGEQLCILRDGEMIVDHAAGIARDGVAMTSDHLNIWMSSTKPVAAVAIAQLWERDKLDLDDRVAKFIPEFGVKGKEPITIRHLLTHTGGFRAVGNSWKPLPYEQYVTDICESKLEVGWVPGKKAGYHVASSWFILGELVKRIDGRTFDRYVRDEIFEPLGMTDCYVGMPSDTYDAYRDRIAVMYNTETGTPEPHPSYLPKHVFVMPRPSANGCGPMNQLARFYQMLLNKGALDGTRVVSVQTVEALVARHRVGLYDHTFRHNLDWCLGFIPNNNQYGWETLPYGFGPHAGLRVFGHSGNQSSIAMADPDANLIVALVFNGMPGDAKHNPRIRAVMTAIYEDLALTPSPFGRGLG